MILKKRNFYEILKILSWRKKIPDRKSNVPGLSGIDGLCSVLISLVDQLASLYEQDDQRRALLFKGLLNLVSGIQSFLSWIHIRIFSEAGKFQRYYFVCL